MLSCFGSYARNSSTPLKEAGRVNNNKPRFVSFLTLCFSKISIQLLFEKIVLLYLYVPTEFGNNRIEIMTFKRFSKFWRKVFPLLWDLHSPSSNWSFFYYFLLTFCLEMAVIWRYNILFAYFVVEEKSKMYLCGTNNRGKTFL